MVSTLEFLLIHEIAHVALNIKIADRDHMNEEAKQLKHLEASCPPQNAYNPRVTFAKIW